MGDMIQNALAPEEKLIIENVMSLLQEFLAMNNASTEQVAEQVAEQAMDEQEEDQINKDETAEADAEERLDNQTKLTDESLQDLKKSIKTLSGIMAKRTTQSPRKIEKSQPDAVLKQLGGVLTKINQRMDDQEKFNEVVMNALGYSDEVIKKAIPEEQAVNKDKPLQGLDTKLFVKEMLTEVFKNLPNMQQQNQDFQPTQHAFNVKRNSDDGVRKDLKTIAEFVHNGGRR